MCVVYHVIAKGYWDNIGLHLSLGPFAWDTRSGIFGLGCDSGPGDLEFKAANRCSDFLKPV